MKEELLHYIWRMRRFDIQQLLTTHGNTISIQHFGHYNTDSGPDFKNARITIDKTLWVGHVEMHINSSDWVAHGHQTDPAYENVVLHVVMNDDAPVRYPNGHLIPTLILNPALDTHLIANYQRLQYQQNWVPCESSLSTVPTIKKEFWLDRMLTERLQLKAERIENMLKTSNYDWTLAFYMSIARSFGFRKNGEAMEALAFKLPLSAILKHHDQLNQLEAMLFGCAGMLTGQMTTTYGKSLKKEYIFLKTKFDLEEINPVMWQFFRMRPANFPTIRIAQLAHLLHVYPNLLNRFLEIEKAADIVHWLTGIVASDFWNTHFHFNKESAVSIKKLGKQSIYSMVINSMAPFLFLYGKYHDQESIQQRAIDMLTEIPAEHNSIIKSWKEAGIKANHAGHSQGLIHLKKNYCDQRNCLKCSIGYEILTENKTPKEVL